MAMAKDKMLPVEPKLFWEKPKITLREANMGLSLAKHDFKYSQS